MSQTIPYSVDMLASVDSADAERPHSTCCYDLFCGSSALVDRLAAMLSALLNHMQSFRIAQAVCEYKKTMQKCAAMKRKYVQAECWMQHLLLAAMAAGVMTAVQHLKLGEATSILAS